MVPLPEYLIPDTVDPNSAEAIAVLIAQVIQSRESFNRDQVVDEVIAVATALYPTGWDAFTADSDRLVVAHRMRVILSFNRRWSHRRHVLAVTAHRIEETAVALAEDRPPRLVMHYEVGGIYSSLGSMTKRDLLATADRLEQLGRGLLYQAMLLRKVAKKLHKDQTVADVWTPEQLDALFGDRNAA